MIFANMETFKATVEHARDNTKELSRIGVNEQKHLSRHLERLQEIFRLTEDKE